MSDRSAIEWTGATWNPVHGCTKVSPGCAHCYIERTPPFRTSGRRFERVGNEETTGVVLRPHVLEQPLRWRKPRMIFVCSLADLFHENVPDEFITSVFRTMRDAPQHTFQVLTKRPERALDWMQGYWRSVGVRSDQMPFLPNVWLGVSIENSRYTWRADVLREIPAAVRFISAEPLLGSLFEEPRRRDGRGGRVGEANWGTYDPDESGICRNCGRDFGGHAGQGCFTARARGLAPGKARLDLTDIDWLIVGGESGGRFARPMHPDWARELREKCQAFSVAFFFKQWGSWVPVSQWMAPSLRIVDDGFDYRGAGPKSGGRSLDGREWNEMPGVAVAA